MKKYMLIILLLAFFKVNGQGVMMSIDNRSINLEYYTIVISKDATKYEILAAHELQKYLEKMTYIRLPIIKDDTDPTALDIVVGMCSGRAVTRDQKPPEPDGFFIRTKGKHLIIAGGTDKGTLYGVYTFLQKFLGCRFYAPGVEEIPKLDQINLNNVNYREVPAFKSREVYYAGMADQEFADKMQCDRNAWQGAENWGMWVHTMFSLVPPDKYFDTHPEYYALMTGKRGKTQLCLTNPDVLRITIEELGKKMKEKPNAKYWSVSQMDTYGSCECRACKAIDKREGSPSGAMIEFVNKVAAAYPDKIISTLAYQYTRSAPKLIKPASNVNIMLCTIECDRNKPISSDTSKGSFYADLRDWSRISNDILVWDYVIQFTNMIAPFPNFHVLQPNIQLFKKFNVTGVFEQGCHGTYSENQEVRQYILAKLLWNPNLNLDSLMIDFYRGYYGNAGNWIKKYNNEMEKAQVASGMPLWIYGSPAQETASFLRPDLVRKYDTWFDEAEYSVTLDPEGQARVKKARLPLRYAKIEIARKNITGPDGFMENIDGKLATRKSFTDEVNTFVDLANLYDVKSIHERGLSPDQYKEEVINSIKNAFTEHLALNKSYTLKNPPSVKYMADGAASLTDGKRGFSNFHILWQGFEGEDFEMTIDLGEPTEINYVGAEFLQDITSWIFMPEFVTYSGSDDGEKFQELSRVENTVSPQDKTPVVIKLFDQSFPTVKTRYIRVFAKSVLVCPDWHIGHGGKAWVFVDEVIVKKN